MLTSKHSTYMSIVDTIIRTSQLSQELKGNYKTPAKSKIVGKYSLIEYFLLILDLAETFRISIN